MEIKEKLNEKSLKIYTKLYTKFREKRGGDDYTSKGVDILTAVVIGALILGAIYLLWGDTIIPTLKQRIVDMFDYKG
jgi:hypothetical protein